MLHHMLRKRMSEHLPSVGTESQPVPDMIRQPASQAEACLAGCLQCEQPIKERQIQTQLQSYHLP